MTERRPERTLDLSTRDTTALRWLSVALILCCLGGCRTGWQGFGLDRDQSNRWIQDSVNAAQGDGQPKTIAQIQKAIAVRPSDPTLREQLASAYIQQGKSSLAIDQLARATDLTDDNASLCVKLGSLYLDNGQWIAASQFAERAIRADRDLPEAWALRAETERVKGELNAALSDFQRALSLRKNYPEIQFKVAEVQYQLGRPMRAFSTIEQLLSQTTAEQQPAEALTLAGRLLIELNRPAQAIEKLQVAAARDDASIDCFARLSQAFLAVGQPDQARLTLVRGSQVYPDSSLISGRLAELQRENHRIAANNRVGSEFSR